MTAGLVASVAVICGGLLWLASGIYRIGRVSRGTPIPERPNDALLLIDLQTIFWEAGPYDPVARSSAASAILSEVEKAKARSAPVIAVRQEWSIPSTKWVARLMMNGQAVEGTPGTDIAAPFAGLADHVIVKRVQDAFETGALDTLLARLDVGRLTIVGLDYAYCVQKTALAARGRGYKVVVVEAGTLSAGPSERTKTRMIAADVVIG